MISKEALLKIRVMIPESEASDEKLAKVLYEHPMFLESEADKALRERVVYALGYDPNDKWA